MQIDRYKAAKLGISVEHVQNILYAAYGAEQISTLYTPTAQYDVILELDPKISNRFVNVIFSQY